MPYFKTKAPDGLIAAYNTDQIRKIKEHGPSNTLLFFDIGNENIASPFDAVMAAIQNKLPASAQSQITTKLHSLFTKYYDLSINGISQSNIDLIFQEMELFINSLTYNS